MRKKILSLLLCAAMATGVCATSAGAVQLVGHGPGIISPFYLYTNSISASLSISGGKATISGVITGYSTVTKIEYTVYAQIKNGSTWRDAGSWSGSAKGTSATYSYTKSDLISGETYRTKTVATVYSGTQSETITAYSVERKA